MSYCCIFVLKLRNYQNKITTLNPLHGGNSNVLRLTYPICVYKTCYNYHLKKPIGTDGYSTIVCLQQV